MSSDRVHTNHHPVSAEGKCLKGDPVQVVIANQIDGKHFFDLNVSALESILLDERIRDRYVAVVSVAGAFRRGKSFLLDFFLRYLDAEGKEDWLGDDMSPLEGFPWRGGAERDTTGILMWSEPFICKLPNGNEVAVLLMDTQGAFDSQSTVKECATVFALSTMLSSIQVYNISNNIQEDNLQHLQLFTEYGRLALENNNKSTPFQHLEFLVRDWSFPYDFDFGEEGGKKLLGNRLQIHPHQHPEHQQIRRHIYSCFKRIGCFLMPHPGLKVATNPRFDGRLSDIDPDFITHLRVLVPMMLSPSTLVVKEINGSKVTGREFLEYFKVYVKIYQGDDLPEPKSMLQATAEANNLAALASSKDIYTKEMERICGGERPYISPELLEQEHVHYMEKALDNFKKTRKMGGEEFSALYLEQLETGVAAQFEQYKANNQSKNLMVGARTPLVILGSMLLVYFVSAILSVIGLDPVSSLLTWLIWVGAIALISWIYVNYSGEYRNVGQTIDQVAEFILDKMLRPLYINATQQTVQFAINRQMGNRNNTANRVPDGGPQSLRSKRD